MRVEVPFDPALLAAARERFRRVLGATLDTLPAREYGPNFTCRKCQGVGELKCALCDDAGIAKRSKKKKDGTPKEGKPCTKSKGKPMLPCSACTDGLVTESELGFPCGWCPFLKDCYPFARTVIDKKPFTRPHIVVKREDFDKAGICIETPERVA